MAAGIPQDLKRAPTPARRPGRLRKRYLGAALAVSASVIGLFNLVASHIPAEAGVVRVDLELPPQVAVAPEPRSAKTRWREVRVRSGQTLAQIFDELGLSAGDVHAVVHSGEAAQQLTRIFPGDLLRFEFDAEEQLATVLYSKGQERLTVSRGEDGFTATQSIAPIDREIRQATGIIEDSLFVAGRQAGLSDKMIMELAGLFGWDIDFILDIRAGDRFDVIYEELYLDGEHIGSGNILAASFTNQGEEFRTLRYETEDGAQYFTPDGRNMKKAFLRAPVRFDRVSSNFNMRRFHPVLKRVKPHRGVDYAARPGTPVMAAGDGRVTRAGYDKYNGHHVFIQHPNGVTTKYLHFSKRLVKKGQKVRQGQKIGLVGATGLASGPHLHYEFVVNGVHRNPRTVDLPKADPLPRDQLPGFRAATQSLLAELDRMRQTRNVAMLAP